MELDFSRYILENYLWNSIFIKIRRVGFEFFHADRRQTGRQGETDSGFSQVCEGASIKYNTPVEH
jgi:hypothetical protein